MIDRDYRYEELARRVSDLESTRPAVIASKVDSLIDEVKWLRRGVIGLAFMLALAAISFAFNATQFSHSALPFLDWLGWWPW